MTIILAIAVCIGWFALSYAPMILIYMGLAMSCDSPSTTNLHKNLVAIAGVGIPVIVYVLVPVLIFWFIV